MRGVEQLRRSRSSLDAESCSERTEVGTQSCVKFLDNAPPVGLSGLCAGLVRQGYKNAGVGIPCMQLHRKRSAYALTSSTLDIMNTLRVLMSAPKVLQERGPDVEFQYLTLALSKLH